MNTKYCSEVIKGWYIPSSAIILIEQDASSSLHSLIAWLCVVLIEFNIWTNNWVVHGVIVICQKTNHTRSVDVANLQYIKIMYSLPTQVLAYSLGLGTLVQDETKLRRHMRAELQYNDSPYGLLVLTGMSSLSI